MNRPVLVLTEDSDTQLLPEGVAGQVFGGSFQSVASLVQQIRKHRPVDFRIISRYGLVSDGQRIGGPPHQSLETALDQARHVVTDWQGDMILALAAKTAQSLTIGTRKPISGKVFAIVSASAEQSVKQFFGPDRVHLFRRVGVARVPSEARPLMVNQLTRSA